MTRKPAQSNPAAQTDPDDDHRPVWRTVLIVLAVVSFLLSPLGPVVYYPVLVWFGVDRWFPASESIVLSDVSGPDVDVAGTDARRLEVAKLFYLCRLRTDVDESWNLADPGSGPSVRVKVRGGSFWRARDLARTIRREYERQTTDPEARLAADFASWPERLLDDRTLPPSVDLRATASGDSLEPVFDGTARLVLRAGTNAVPHLLELVTAPGQRSFPIEAHILLCWILGVIQPYAAPDEWCGVWLVQNPFFRDWKCDPVVLSSYWERYRKTGALPFSDVPATTKSKSANPAPAANAPAAEKPQR